MIKKKIKIKKNEFVFTSLYIYGKYTMVKIKNAFLFLVF
jgi:hypothetical protein